MLRRIGGILGVAVLVAGCLGSTPASSGEPSPASSTSAAAPTGSSTAESSRAPLTIAGRPLSFCIVGRFAAQCGTLNVPEDRSKPTGRTIDLRVVVVPAQTPNPAPDPVFFLAGGPGGAASQSYTWAPETFAGIHANRDIVLVDQRGTGGSNELWLTNPPDATGLSEAATRELFGQWASQAFAKLKADPAMYTTEVAMDDLDAVRVALGYDQIDLYGASYGATALQYYLRQHPERVRVAILDGGTLLDVPVFERIAPSSQRALDMLFLRCAADTACRTAYPDLPNSFQTVLKTLAAKTVDTGVTDPMNPGTITLDRDGFAAVIHNALTQSDLAASVPWLIDAASKGEWTLVGQALAAVSQPELTSIQVMSGIIRCSEAWARFDPKNVATEGAGSYYLDVELATARQQALACEFAPKGVVPANDAQAATGTMPVLLLTGDADPQDPPSNEADAPIDFPNSRSVIVPGQGHTVGHLGCLPTIVDAFISSGTTVGLDTSCVATMVPPPFRLP